MYGMKGKNDLLKQVQKLLNSVKYYTRGPLLIYQPLRTAYLERYDDDCSYIINSKY
jgi:hypothetical protein